MSGSSSLEDDPRRAPGRAACQGGHARRGTVRADDPRKIAAIAWPTAGRNAGARRVPRCVTLGVLTFGRAAVSARSGPIRRGAAGRADESGSAPPSAAIDDARRRLLAGIRRVFAALRRALVRGQQRVREHVRSGIRMRRILHAVVCRGGLWQRRRLWGKLRPRLRLRCAVQPVLLGRGVRRRRRVRRDVRPGLGLLRDVRSRLFRRDLRRDGRLRRDVHARLGLHRPVHSRMLGKRVRHRGRLWRDLHAGFGLHRALRSHVLGSLRGRRLRRDLYRSDLRRVLTPRVQEASRAGRRAPARRDGDRHFAGRPILRRRSWNRGSRRSAGETISASWMRARPMSCRA